MSLKHQLCARLLTLRQKKNIIEGKEENSLFQNDTLLPNCTLIKTANEHAKLKINKIVLFMILGTIKQLQQRARKELNAQLTKKL